MPLPDCDKIVVLTATSSSYGHIAKTQHFIEAFPGSDLPERAPLLKLMKNKMLTA